MAIESAARPSSTTASASSLSFTLSSTHYATPSTSTSTSASASIDASTTPAALAIPPIDPTKFGPRTGVLTFTRPSSSSSPNADASASADFESITIETPGLLTTTSRGVVPHIAWDTYERHAEMGPLKWVNVPWESFLEHNPPVPTLFASSASATKDPNETNKPFHHFLGFKPRNHILSLSARDADDTKEMPPNGNDVVSVSTLRGVRKLTPTSYLAHIHALNPDLIFALHDTPFTNPPYSQKRLTKSIERSGAWIGTLLGLAPPSSGSGSASDSARGKKKKGPKQEKGTKGAEGQKAIETKLAPVQAPIIAPLVGSTSLPARAYYAKTLLEPFSALEYNNIYGVDLEGHKSQAGGKGEEEGGKRLGCLDDGVAGYSFELRSLEKDLAASSLPASSSPSSTNPSPPPSSSPNPSSSPSPSTTSPPQPHPATPHLQTSLSSLPHHKPRITFGIRSPHEILLLVRDVGVDILDAGWAVEAGGVGVGFDFVFPVREEDTGGVRELGHNLYSTKYTMDFSPIADTFRGPVPQNDAGSAAAADTAKPICPCYACSPRSFDGDAELIRHGVDSDGWICGEGEGATAASASNKATSTSTTANATSSTTDASQPGNNAPPPSQSGNNAPPLSIDTPRYNPPHTRAYIHHLLHTHEMSAHALLVSHNLAVVEAFLRGVRGVLGGSSPLGNTVSCDATTTTSSTSTSPSTSTSTSASASTTTTTNAEEARARFEKEVEKFFRTYKPPSSLLDEAREQFREVDLARGKGRLGREREKELGESVGVVGVVGEDA